MAKKYTRKQLGSLKSLDKEQERIRNKSREIEHDFLDLLNPQQLAISLLGNVINRKINGGGKEKDRTGKKQSSASYGKVSGINGNLQSVVKHPLFKNLLKKVGISFLKWQAFNLALFAGKKIVKVIKDKKREKEQRLALAVVSNKKKI